MKPPDAVRPSGDRLMARQLLAALARAGHEARVVSRLRTWLEAPGRDAFARIEAEAETERRRLLGAWRGPAAGAGRSDPWRPDVWLTYHLYYRAPDLVGPLVAAALGIPYVAVEASHAPRREDGPWAPWADHAARAMRGADLLLAMTGRDLAGLEAMAGRTGRLAHFPPFLAEPGCEPPARRQSGAPAGPVTLATVAMMRPGGKRLNYGLLAAALSHLPRGGFRLLVAGDGAAGGAVRAELVEALGAQVSFVGEIGPDAVRSMLDEADIFIWPGHREPYGMVYLEAAARGLPAAAMASGGVPDVVRHGETGLLAPDGEVAALAGTVARLIGEPELRARLGRAARRFAVGERGLAAASARLDAHLAALAGRSAA